MTRLVLLDIGASHGASSQAQMFDENLSTNLHMRSP